MRCLCWPAEAVPAAAFGLFLCSWLPQLGYSGTQPPSCPLDMPTLLTALLFQPPCTGPQNVTINGNLIVNGNVLFKGTASAAKGLTVSGGQLQARAGLTVTGSPLVATSVTTQLGTTTIVRTTTGAALTINATANASSLAISTTSPVSLGRLAATNTTVGVSSAAEVISRRLVQAMHA